MVQYGCKKPNGKNSKYKSGGQNKQRRWRNWHELSIERFKFFHIHTLNCPPQIWHAFFSMHVAKGVRSLSFPLYMSFSCCFCFFLVFFLNAEKSLCWFFKHFFFVWLIIWQCNRLLLNASLFALLFASTSHMKLCRIPYEIKCYHVNVPCTMLMCVNQMKLCHVAQFRYFCKLFSQATRE